MDIFQENYKIWLIHNACQTIQNIKESMAELYLSLLDLFKIFIVRLPCTDSESVK